MVQFNSIHPDDKHLVDSAIVNFEKGIHFEIEYRIQDKNSKYHWFLDRSIGRTTTDNEVVIEGIASDITDMKNNEARLEEFSLQLEKSNKELEHFAYIASHDLQEPIRKIISFTELFAKQYLSTEDEKADRYIHYIVDTAQRMSRLVNSLLEYSRVGRAELKFDTVDVNEVISLVLEDLEVQISASNAKIIYGDLPTLEYDFTLLSRIFQNMISNAIKFKSEREPLIEINAAREVNRWVFSVKDNGIGIDMQYESRVFTIFQRLHNREIAGTGIGLPLCKKIVERYGGNIWFSSSPGKGSTFYFTILDKEEGLNEQTKTD